MAQNLEIKIKVDSHDQFINILKEKGAENKGILNQRDIYFDWPKGLLKLRVQNDRNELIKYVRNEAVTDRFSNYEILLLEGNNSEEYLSDILNVKVVVEKDRVLYLYKNTRVHLDTVKNLGLFLELETVVNSEDQNVQGEFDEVVEMLNLNTDEQILCSYRDLLLEKK